MIAVVGTPSSNSKAIVNAFNQLGHLAVVTTEKERILNASHIVLPGVGAFGPTVSALDDLGIMDLMRNVNNLRVPLLGVCLGLQLLTKGSDESPGTDGLQIFDSYCLKFQKAPSIPHVGWNTVVVNRNHWLFKDINTDFAAYFSHSYYLPQSAEYSIALTTHGETYTSIYAKDHVTGIQFHPEKSQRIGLKLLDNFYRFGRHGL